MNFLAKMGSILLNIVSVATGLQPLIHPYLSTSVESTVSTAVDKLKGAFNVVLTTEQLFANAFGPDAKKGSDKLNAAAPFVAQLVRDIDLFTGKHPKNEALFQDAVRRLTSAVADIFSSFDA